MVLTCVQLVVLPWAFGGVDVGSQLFGALCAVPAFALALHASRGQFSRSAPGLVRDPVFWAGLVLFAYVAIQGENPAYVYGTAGTDWWLDALPHPEWLPAGMRVPFLQAGPWRTLLVWVPPWMLACALRHGITRRGTATVPLVVMAANGFALAAFGLVQRAAGTESIYGIRQTLSAEIFASFIYRNHAAAYLNVIALVAIALALRSYDRARRQGATGHDLSPLYTVFAATALCAVLLTFSLAGILFAAIGGAVIGVAVIFHYRNPLRRSGLARAGLAVTAGLALLIGGLATWAGADGFADQLGPKFGHGRSRSVQTRLAADRAGWEMWQDRPLLGWGAGCFRYGFTKYQKLEPQITHAGSARLFWEHLHNDWLEWLIELGVIGLLPVMAIMGTMLREFWRLQFWHQPSLLCGVLALVALGAHAWGDFPLQNPAILTTAAALAALLPHWSETKRPDPARESRGDDERRRI